MYNTSNVLKKGQWTAVLGNLSVPVAEKRSVPACQHKSASYSVTTKTTKIKKDYYFDICHITRDTYMWISTKKTLKPMYFSSFCYVRWLYEYTWKPGAHFVHNILYARFLLNICSESPHKLTFIRCHTAFSFFTFHYPGTNMAGPDIFLLKK